MTRLLDLIFSLMGLIILSPLFLIIAIVNMLLAPGPVFYVQTRIGRNGKEFRMFKFRSMYVDADKRGLLITTSERDPRITPIGFFLRKYKLDELPQLWNVLIGDMSIVGPRPEVKKYVDLYTPEQRQVLNVRPGITDTASLIFRNENEILSQQPNPEQYYIEVIMPEKIRLNQSFIANPTLTNYLKIIINTIRKI